jgi:ABC-2 type transport system permease protein
MVAAVRELFGFHNMFGATKNSFPSQHPIQTSLLYLVLILAIFVPLSVRRYRNTNK